MLKRAAAATVALIIAVPTWAGVLPGGTPTDEALRQGALAHNIESVKAALKNGGNPNSPSNTGRRITPLYAAAMGSWTLEENGSKNETANKLLRQGNISRDEIDNYLAFEIAKALFAAGATLGLYDSLILFHPIANGNVKLVELFIDKGASVTGDLDGYTPTELAKKYGQEAIHELLVSRGGIPVDSRSGAQLALIEAAGDGDVEGMEKAIKDGARINEIDTNKQTALVAAVRIPTIDLKRPASVWWLLDHGADPNLKDIYGLPLHVFVEMNAGTMRRDGSLEQDLANITLARLLKAGAKVSGMDDTGQTALHVAAKYDNVHAAEMLIKEGAKVMPKDRAGKTPLDYAESAPMIKLLKQNGATER
jgi:ankyrin repeat protein